MFHPEDWPTQPQQKRPVPPLEKRWASAAGLSPFSRLRGRSRPISPASAPPRSLAAGSLRVGAVGIKCGMTQFWNEFGESFPVTVLWLDDNVVTQVKTREADGVTSVQVGAGVRKAKQIPKSLLGHYRAWGVPMKHRLMEFPVTRDALLPVGTAITAMHFVPGQYIDVIARTKSKGFQASGPGHPTSREGAAARGEAHP